MAALAAEAVVNGNRLLGEAQTLLEIGAWPSSYALATLAFEEIGKAYLCTTVLGLPSDIMDGPGFWRAFRSHEAKLKFAHIMAALVGSAGPASTVGETFQAATDAAVGDNSAKFRGLYVDYADGAVLRPADVDESRARTMVELVDEVLAFARPLYSIDNLLGLLNAPAEVRAEFQNRMRRLVERVSNADGLMWAMRLELRPGIAPDLPVS